MLTCPPQARFFRQRALKQRRGVDKGSKIQRNAVLLDSFTQFFEAVAQELVVITAQRVTANVTERRIF